MIDSSEAERLERERKISLDLVHTGDDGLTFSGTARLVEPEGLSVISDIDDTIKITEVRDSRRMLERSLLEDFAPVPGMAALYQDWTEQGAVVRGPLPSRTQQPLALTFLALRRRQAG